jgi:hypothetical protein
LETGVETWSTTGLVWLQLDLDLFGRRSFDDGLKTSWTSCSSQAACSRQVRANARFTGDVVSSDWSFALATNLKFGRVLGSTRPGVTNTSLKSA